MDAIKRRSEEKKSIDYFEQCEKKHSIWMINAKQFLYVHKKYVLRSVTMRSKSMNTRREKNWKMFYVNAFSSLAFSSSRFSLIEKRKCFIQEDSFREWVRTTKSRKEKKRSLVNKCQQQPMKMIFEKRGNSLSSRALGVLRAEGKMPFRNKWKLHC